MSSFQNMRKNRKNAFDKLRDQVQKMDQRGAPDADADLYWKPTRDSAGNGFAIIRFLPEPDGEDNPFVRLWNHAFQGPGGWYIENSRTTLGKDEADPVSEYNTKLWAMSNDDDSPERKQARKQKRKLNFISNIYVIKDSGNPENEGKVFLFKYGKKIFDLLKEQMHPSFEDETPVDPFDLDVGANFRLKVRNGDGGFPNYDKSEFDNAGPLFDNDDDLEAVWKQIKSLTALIAPDQFKPYETLSARLNKVLALDGGSDRSNVRKRVDEPSIDEDEEIDMSAIANKRRERAQPEVSKSREAVVTETASSDEDEDEDLEFFRNLAAKGKD